MYRYLIPMSYIVAYGKTYKHGQNTKRFFPRHFLECEKGSNNAQYRYTLYVYYKILYFIM